MPGYIITDKTLSSFCPAGNHHVESVCVTTGPQPCFSMDIEEVLGHIQQGDSFVLSSAVDWRQARADFLVCSCNHGYVLERGPVASQLVLSEEKKQYLQTIFNYFHDQGKWPTYRYVERRLITDSDLDARRIARDLAYAIPGMPSAEPWNPDWEAVLTIPAMTLCQGAELELSAFMAALKLAVSKYLSSDEPRVHITSGEVKDALHADDRTLARLVYLIRIEPCLYESLSEIGEAKWDFVISSDIIRYRKVGSLPDYLRVRQGPTVPSQIDDRALALQASPVTTYGRESLPGIAEVQPPTVSGDQATVDIFVSYRRDDSAGSAGRLYADLNRRYGAGRVFMDVAGIEPGVEWRQEIQDALFSCKVFLAIIGKQWLTITDTEEGCRRLDLESDWVRRETAEALQRGIRVIPVLVDGAHLPKSDDLPDELRPLLDRQCHEITVKRWDYDTEVLMTVIDPVIGVSPTLVANTHRSSAPQEAVQGTPSTRYPDPTLTVEAQKILQFLTRSFPPEAVVPGEDMAKAVGIVDRGLSDALNELEDANLIRGMGKNGSPSRYTKFILNISAWDHVNAGVVGFDVVEDMILVATVASKYDQIDRDNLLAETGLPEHRLDIAALLLKEKDLVGIYRPLVRGLTFGAILTSHKTCIFARTKNHLA